MKKRNSYGIGRKRDGLCWVSVERQGREGWIYRKKGFIPNDAEAGLAGFERPEASQSGLAVLPGSWVHSGVAVLPPLNDKELRRALELWAVREFGVEADDLALVWKALEQEESSDGPVKVFASLMSRSKRDELMGILAGLEMSPQIMTPDYLALDLFLREFMPGIEELDTWCFVHVGHLEAFLGIATREGLLLHRALLKDSFGEGEGQRYVERLSTEILRSVHRARQIRSNLRIGTFYLSGEEKLIGALADSLRSERQVRVETWRITDFIKCEDGVLSSDIDLLMPAVGAVVAGLGRETCNLLPRTRRGLLSPKVLRRAAIAGAALGALLLPLALGSSLYALRQSSLRLEELSREREALEPLAAQADSTRLIWTATREREMRLTEERGSTRFLADVLAEIALRAPSQIHLQSLEIREGDGGATLQLSGESLDERRTRAQEAFLRYAQALDDSEYLLRRSQSERVELDEKEEESEEMDEGGAEAQKRVLFELEYEIRPPLAEKGSS